MTTAKQDNDLYEVIIIESGKDYTVQRPGNRAVDSCQSVG